MASDSSSPEQPGRVPPDASGEPAEQARPAEPFGVVEVARHRKDDGRALLLYTRIEAEGA